jgi:hypothetical protein
MTSAPMFICVFATTPSEGRDTVELDIALTKASVDVVFGALLFAVEESEASDTREVVVAAGVGVIASWGDRSDKSIVVSPTVYTEKVVPGGMETS